MKFKKSKPLKSWKSESSGWTIHMLRYSNNTYHYMLVSPSNRHTMIPQVIAEDFIADHGYEEITYGEGQCTSS